ncbi:phenylacetate--CoA ligase family protein [Peribacillus sp. NPDC101481]|uniref:phenylacetate--CoA ligase family protein n=1 Tax=Peribacillus sp. NPDC101481 TaxID=3364403 RepID=UPI0037FCADC6
MLEKYPKFKFTLKLLASLLPDTLLEKREYKDYRSFLEGTKNWGNNEVLEFQNLQLRLVLQHSMENVPYYQEVWNNYGIKIKQIQNVSDLKELPLIDKEIVKLNREKFIAGNINKNHLIPINTGGTTSSPLHFFNTKTTNNREWAFYKMIWSEFGYNNELVLFLRGRFGKFEGLFEYNPYRKYLIINTENFSEKKMLETLNLIYEKKPKFIQAYPSMIFLLSKFINENKYHSQVTSIKGIFCASEKMFDFQKEEISKAFNCPVIDYYGHNERLVLMVRQGIEKYEILPEYGIAEFLNNENMNVNEEGQQAEIVGTGFNNYAFPLIRYKTGDIATLGPIKKYKNRPIEMRTISEIDGRSGDFLKTADGKYYSPTMLEFAIRYISNFKDLQLVQTDIENLIVYIVPTENYSSAEGEKFKQALAERIAYSIKINIKIVTSINRPDNLKHRFLVSKL